MARPIKPSHFRKEVASLKLGRGISNEIKEFSPMGEQLEVE